MTGGRLLPPQASTHAPGVDRVLIELILVSGLFTLLIMVLIVVFAIRYRRGRHPRAVPTRTSLALEVTWSVVPLAFGLWFFAAGARLYVRAAEPPDGALEIRVVGKQWMWTFDHPSGKREKNLLHVPAGTPIVLRMISEDVIHSLFVPAFRLKQDVLPGRYTRLWFEAGKPGIHHLFCAEYCGTEHSRMRGSVVILAPDEYARWSTTFPDVRPPAGASRGEQIFQERLCASCHEPADSARAPGLAGLLGRQVHLADGRTIVADADYVRESILDPTAAQVAGWPVLMPSFAGVLSEEDILALIDYIASLQPAVDGGEERR